MLLNIFCILQLTIAANFDSYFKGLLCDPIYRSNSIKYWPTQLQKFGKKDYSVKFPACAMMSYTQKSPFIVYVLYKTSGHFLGMGSIIDRKTILTSYKVIMISISHPVDILVLAGSLTPWWGRNSQVRQVQNVITNEYELALLQIKPDWIFNDIVLPIRLNENLYFVYTPIYGRHYATFGITVDSYFASGTQIQKSVTYSMEIEYSVHEDWNTCYLSHPSMDPKLNQNIHICAYPNHSRCHGILGSPLVGVNNQGEARLAAVVVRTECLEYERMHVSVKLSYFDKFIKSNSLLG